MQKVRGPRRGSVGVRMCNVGLASRSSLPHRLDLHSSPFDRLIPATSHRSDVWPSIRSLALHNPDFLIVPLLLCFGYPEPYISTLTLALTLTLTLQFL